MSEGQNRLWLRRLDSASAEPLAGTDGAGAPFWSPDSRSIAFFTSTDNRLKRLDIDGRSMQVLGTFPIGIGGTWNRDGTILLSYLGGPSSLFRVSSNGGPGFPVTPRQAPEVGHLLQFLPDGKVDWSVKLKVPSTPRAVKAEGPARRSTSLAEVSRVASWLVYKSALARP